MTTTQTPTPEYVNTHELCEGDTIRNHGMVIVLGERHVSVSHPTNEFSPTLWFHGTVTNREDFAPGGPLADPFIYHHSADGWTVQGNRLAMWVRIDRAACDHEFDGSDVYGWRCVHCGIGRGTASERRHTCGMEITQGDCDVCDEDYGHMSCCHSYTRTGNLGVTCKVCGLYRHSYETWTQAAAKARA